jgi:hypothetical protein
MKETSYRVDPKPALKSCTKCGRPTEPDRLVYSKPRGPQTDRLAA